MIEVKLRVAHKEHGEYMVAVDAATIMAAEDFFGTTVQEMFNPVSMTRLGFLAWEQTRSEGVHTVTPWEQWKRGLRGVDAEVDDDPLTDGP